MAWGWGDLAPDWRGIGRGVAGLVNRAAGGAADMRNQFLGQSQMARQQTPYQDFFGSLYRYNQAMQPSYASGMVASGMNAMNNMGGAITQAAGNAAALSSQNLQARYAADAARANAEAPIWQEFYRQQGQNQRLEAMAPLIASLFGVGGGGGRGGIDEMTTNYGAGFSTDRRQQGAPRVGGGYGGGAGVGVNKYGALSSNPQAAMDMRMNRALQYQQLKKDGYDVPSWATNPNASPATVASASMSNYYGGRENAYAVNQQKLQQRAQMAKDQYASRGLTPPYPIKWNT